VLANGAAWVAQDPLLALRSSLSEPESSEAGSSRGLRVQSRTPECAAIGETQHTWARSRLGRRNMNSDGGRGSEVPIDVIRSILQSFILSAPRIALRQARTGALGLAVIRRGRRPTTALFLNRRGHCRRGEASWLLLLLLARQPYIRHSEWSASAPPSCAKTPSGCALGAQVRV
jgi:hypothetical protein